MFDWPNGLLLLLLLDPKPGAGVELEIVARNRRRRSSVEGASMTAARGQEEAENVRGDVSVLT